MKIPALLTIAATLIAMPGAWSDDSNVPDSTMATASAVIGTTSGLIVPHDNASAMLIGHSHGEGTYTAFKGALGENLMDDYYAQKGDWHRMEPARVNRSRVTGELYLQRSGRQGRSGLDGVFIRYDRAGKPQRVMVTEAKAFGSQLALDVTGERQFSPRYRESRLALTAQYYQEAAHNIEIGNVNRTFSRPQTQSLSQIPLDPARSISLWFDPVADKWTYYGEGSVSRPEVAKQLNRISVLLQDTAEGKIGHTARLFRFNIDLDETITIKIIDPEGGLQRQHTGKLTELPDQQQVMIRRTMVRSIAEDLRSNNRLLTYEDAQKKAASMVSEAERRGKVGELAHRYRPALRYSPSIGLSGASQAGALGAIIAGVADVASQLSSSGKLDLSKSGSLLGLGAASGLLGTWSGAQTQFVLNSQPAQRLSGQLANSIGGSATAGSSAGLLARVGGGMTGGSVAGAIFSYGAYAMGMTDLQTANRSMAAGTAGAAVGVAASEATIALVAAYGTASTGTAIGSLSGVAASNASLAWLGGGSVAAGGMGTAGGAVVLSTGVGIVIVGIASATMYIFYVVDSIDNQKRIEYLIRTVGDSLRV